VSPNWTARTAALVLAVALNFGAGMAVGWRLWSPENQKARQPEPPAPALIQADGSRLLERRPDPAARPAQSLPKGARVERVVQVLIQPTPAPPAAAPVSPPPFASAASPSAELRLESSPAPIPLRVDLTLLRLPDQTRRILASSPDGRVVGGLDIPVEAAPPKPLRRAIGLVLGTTPEGALAKGAFYDHDFAFLRTGCEITRTTNTLNRQGWELRARLGIRF